MKTEKRLMRIPVVVVTDEREPKQMVDSFAAGATVFLQKPFTTEQLQRTLGGAPEPGSSEESTELSID